MHNLTIFNYERNNTPKNKINRKFYKIPYKHACAS